ncbi:unnamed protein product, partial [Symbiodinium sp. KB8]
MDCDVFPTSSNTSAGYSGVHQGGENQGVGLNDELRTRLNAVHGFRKTAEDQNQHLQLHVEDLSKRNKKLESHLEIERRQDRAVDAVETELSNMKVTQLEREKTLEEQQDASIRRTLEAVKAKKSALTRRSMELHGLCKDIAAESMKLQEEHARLMLGRARRK